MVIKRTSAVAVRIQALWPESITVPGLADKGATKVVKISPPRASDLQGEGGSNMLSNAAETVLGINLIHNMSQINFAAELSFLARRGLLKRGHQAELQPRFLRPDAAYSTWGTSSFQPIFTLERNQDLPLSALP